MACVQAHSCLRLTQPLFQHEGKLPFPLMTYQVGDIIAGFCLCKAVPEG